MTPTSVRGSRPSTRTVPREGRASPQSIRSIVDLPAPFGPRSAVTPGPTLEADVGDGDERRRTTSRRPRASEARGSGACSPVGLDAPVAEPAGQRRRRRSTRPAPAATSQVESSSIGAPSSGRLVEDPVGELGGDEGEAEQVERVGRSCALDRAPGHDRRARSSRSTTATAAAARRVVKLETAIETEA